MKCIAAVSLVMAFVVAEPPPSNSYLPPPPRSGYSQSSQNSLPQIVAARSQPGRSDHVAGHGAAAGFARSSLQPGLNGAFGSHQANSAQPRFNQGYDQKGQGHDQKRQGYDQNAAALARNALEEGNVEPANYNFGYMVNDQHEGTDFGHHEERQEERAQGEYHVVLPDGRKQTVSYEADERGFKPQISYEDTEDLTRSGYDSNANNFRSSNGQGNEHGYNGNEHSYNGNERGYNGNEHSYSGNEKNGGQNGGYARAGGY